MFPLTEGTRERVRALFPEDEREAVERLLLERCGANLPLVNGWHGLVERIRYAVLKLSDGDRDALARHVAIACVDWRDVLVAARFAHDPLAHLEWQPEIRRLG